MNKHTMNIQHSWNKYTWYILALNLLISILTYGNTHGYHQYDKQIKNTETLIEQNDGGMYFSNVMINIFISSNMFVVKVFENFVYECMILDIKLVIRRFL